MNDNNLNNETNNSENSTVSPRIVKPIPVENAETSKTSAPTDVNSNQEKEVGTVIVGKPMSNIVKPIPVGEVGASAPQAVIGGAVEEPVKKSNNPVVVVLLILVIVSLICYALWAYVLKDKIASNNLVGSITSNHLVFDNVKNGDSIKFKVSDKLTLIVDVKNLDVQENNAGTKVIYSIREENGNDSLSLPYGWLTENGGLKIPVTIVGDTAIFSYTNDDHNNEIGFISADGIITIINDYSGILKEEEGLRIENSSENDSTYEVTVTRVVNDSIIKYGNMTSNLDLTQYENNEELLEKYGKYNSDEGVSICLEDAKKIPAETTVTALVTYSVKDNVLDIKNPSISNKVNYSSFVSENSDLLCQ